MPLVYKSFSFFPSSVPFQHASQGNVCVRHRDWCQGVHRSHLTILLSTVSFPALAHAMARIRKAKQLPTTSRTASSGISSTVLEGPPCGERGRGRRRHSSIGEVLGSADLTDSTRISVRGVQAQLRKHSADERVSQSKNFIDDSIIVAFSPSSSESSMSTTNAAEEAGGVSRVFTASCTATR